MGAQHLSVMLCPPLWGTIAACGGDTASTESSCMPGTTQSLTTTLKVGATIGEKVEAQRTQKNPSDLHPATCFRYLLGILIGKQNWLVVSKISVHCLACSCQAAVWGKPATGWGGSAELYSRRRTKCFS